MAGSPAIAVIRGDLGAALKDSGRGSSAGREHRFARGALVVSEVALACLLLIGAGLLLRSFLHVLDVDLGFQPERTYSLRIDAGPEVDSREAFAAHIRRIVGAAESIPGIDPWTFAAAVAVLLTVAAAAGCIPAMRASRIPPVSAMRAD